MDRLNELIQELCPNGVAFVQIKDIADISIGEFVHKNKQVPNGKYPVYNGGTTYTGFYDEWNRQGNQIIISARGNAGFVNRVYTKFWSGNSCYTVTVDAQKADWSYVYYAVKNSEKALQNIQQKGGIPAVSKKQVENLRIPFPPLPVQEEIVRILDSFTELTAELTARRKQYEYYRDELLMSAPKAIPTKLRDLCSFYNGDRGKNYPKASELVENGIPFVNAGDVDGHVDYIGCNKITPEKYQSLNGAKLQQHDILYCLRGSTGKSGIYEMDSGTIASSLVAIRANEKVNYKYLYYLLNSSMELKQRIKSDTGAAQPNLSVQSIGAYEFAVPSHTEQQRIISILDCFDALCNNLTSGLPAEIAARQTQYEYYRDKLLTFKELEA